MKRVFSDIHQIAHLWAHQVQDEARNPQGNFYFYQNTIYSYGSHFPCGKIVFNRSGEKAYVVNSDSYSNTTSKHQWAVESSIPFGAVIFNSGDAKTPYSVDKYHYGFSDAVKVVCEKVIEIEGLMKKEIRAVYRDYKPQILSLIQEINRWIEFWGLNKRQKWSISHYKQELAWQSSIDTYLNAKKRAIEILFKCSNTPEKAASYLLLFNLVRTTKLTESADVKDLMLLYYGSDIVIQETERSAKIEKERARKALALKKQQINDDFQNLEKWKANEKHSWDPSYAFVKKFGWDTSLRIKEKFIETSKHIKISFEEGKRLWALVQAFHNGYEFQHDLALDLNGHRWKINSYENDVLRAGCHMIHYSECQEIANKLGW